VIQLATRIAPTPSGYLHAGNAVNILITQWWARAHGAHLILRIDDFDAARMRPEYLRDVFDTLVWLGIDVDEGPSGPADFAARWSMAHRFQTFSAVRDHLLAEHPDRVFVCRCSRARLEVGRCVAGCRTAAIPRTAGSTVVRLAVAPGATVVTAGSRLAVPAGDHVLWRRDDLPAYHLGSVVADEQLRITTIIRGVDLLDASALQLHLAALIPAPGFAAVELHHHGLLAAPDGQKLSKSSGARAHPLHHDAGLGASIRDWAAEIAAPLGITPC
jgi:glutamyl/glutaminyl-tRNA synthetase